MTISATTIFSEMQHYNITATLTATLFQHSNAVLREKLSYESSCVALPLEQITKDKCLRDFSQWERKLCVNMSLTHLSRSSREAVYANNSQVLDSNYLSAKKDH